MLSAHLPDLFRCAQDKEASVNSFMSMIGGQVVWGPTFRRNLKDKEEPSSLHSLIP